MNIVILAGGRGGGQNQQHRCLLFCKIVYLMTNWDPSSELIFVTGEL